MAVAVLLRRTFFKSPKPYNFSPLKRLSILASTPPSTEPSSLSARMRFVFDQIDTIQEERTEKDQTLQRIRAWRESKKSVQPQPQQPETPVSDPNVAECSVVGQGGLMAKEVEFVHPWPEWIELMERLVQQNYFDHRRKDEDRMIVESGFSLLAVAEQQGIDFTRDWRTVETAVLNLGRDRFDILRALPRQDLQILVGYGCPSADKRIVFSSKVLRKHVHIDEGDVCSSCSLRSSCEKAYLLTKKEDEARTIDVMRVLLMFAFDPINGSVVNKSILKKKSVKSVIRRLLHEVAKLSAVPIDPKLPPPIIKKPQPKVKQPPPTPKKRVGRDDVEMKKGDWLCPKCDFLNFAKNVVCLQCDSKRPKRQLLPGEWECPNCNFLNYRRNMACFHCESKRPPDEFTGSQLRDRQHGPRMNLYDKIPDRASRQDVTNAWNLNFDDDESDGADVAAFEYADSRKLGADFPLDRRAQDVSSKPPKGYETDYSGPQQPGLGFNDFDDEEDDVDSYEVDTHSGMHKNSQINYSDLEDNSEDEGLDANDNNMRNYHHKNTSTNRKKPKSMSGKVTSPGSEDSGIDFDSDNELPIRSNRNSINLSNSKQRSYTRHPSSFEPDDDDFNEEVRSLHKKGMKSPREFGGRRSLKNKYGNSSDPDIDGDDMNYHTSRQRGAKPGQRGRQSSLDRSDGDYRKRKSFTDDSNGRTRDFHRNGKSGWDDKDWNRKDSRGGRNGRGGGSFNRGPRANDYDNQSNSYLNDERYNRPRINVR